MRRYAITDRKLFQGNESQRQSALVAQAGRWAAQGIDLIQLREKDMEEEELTALARRMIEAIDSAPTRLLVNGRPDVAIASGAHGVHLPSAAAELTLRLRALWPDALITVSCHTVAEAEQAAENEADAIVFAPVFEKPIPGGIALPGTGLAQLHAACQAAAPIPVYALGGITEQNSQSCIEAGASGVAGIRLFHSL